MSRSGYSDDFGCDDQWSLIMYRGAVNAAIRGKRGQDFLRRLAALLDAMPVKRLAGYDWAREDGVSCALGVALEAEKPELHEASKSWDPEDDNNAHLAASALNVAPSLAREIIWLNDEGLGHFMHRPWGFIGPIDRDAERWLAVRRWVAENILESAHV